MSLRDGKYEYVRVRSRKDKDKDKDKDRDNRSSIAGSIVVRRQKEKDFGSSSKHGAPADTISQASVDTQAIMNGEPLPPLPESESTSPVLRTTSNNSLGSRTSPSQVFTPANLQPYLESDTGESEGGGFDSLHSSANLEGSREWIGPILESPTTPGPSSEASDAVTPKAIKESFTSPPSKKSRTSSSSERDNSRSMFGLFHNPKKYGSKKTEAFRDNPYPPSEMENPFLHSSSVPDAPSRPHTAASHRSLEAVSASKPSAPSNVSSHESPSLRVATIAHVDPSTQRETKHVAGSYFGQNTNVLSHQGNPDPYEGPFALIQRVANSIPDLHLLMQYYQDSCTSLSAREKQVHDLEVQKDEDNKRLEHLGERLEILLQRHRDEISDLTARISSQDDALQDMQRRVAREAGLKIEARTATENLRAEKRQAERKHADERDALIRSHLQEKEQLVSEHEVDRQKIHEDHQTQLRSTEMSFSARIAEISRVEESNKQIMENHRLREKIEMENDHDKIRQDLEHALNSKLKIIEDERQDSNKLRHAWEIERTDLHSRREEDRTRHRKDMEEMQQSLTRKYQKERDEALRSLQSDYAQMQSKNQATIRDLEQRLEDQAQQMTKARHTINQLEKERDTSKDELVRVQEPGHRFQKESADSWSSLDSVRAPHRGESRDRRSIIFDGGDKAATSRESAGRTSDAYETPKSRNELSKEKERIEDTPEGLNKVRRDPEPVRMQHQTERRTVPKNSPEGKHIYKTTSNESAPSSKAGGTSGAQK